MLPVRKYLPAVGAALEVYPANTAIQDQWVLRYKTLDGRAEVVRYWRHASTQLLPASGIRLEAKPVDDKWRFVYSTYNSSEEIVKEVEPDANLLKVLGSIVKGPVVAALTPIILELNTALKAKLREVL